MPRRQSQPPPVHSAAYPRRPARQPRRSPFTSFSAFIVWLIPRRMAESGDQPGAFPLRQAAEAKPRAPLAAVSRTGLSAVPYDPAQSAPGRLSFPPRALPALSTITRLRIRLSGGRLTAVRRPGGGGISAGLREGETAPRDEKGSAHQPLPVRRAMDSIIMHFNL